MRLKILSLLGVFSQTVFVLFFSLKLYASSWLNTLEQYECLEVEKFQVDRDNYSTKELERAANIPEEDLKSLQHKIVGEISRKHLVSKIVKSNCSGKSVVFGGVVTDYKRGNRAARILIGVGAGKQKFEVESYLKDKKTGEVLASKKIIDRKWAGIAGGDEDKGQQDFAKKVAQFVEKGK